MIPRWILTALAAGTIACDLPAWRHAFASYWREHPRAEATDLYKFAHQGILGSEHAVRDTATVNAWMRREVAALPTRPEPSPLRAALIEQLPPDGRFVRLHLRPYLAQRGDIGVLLTAFVATANGARGDTAQFACAERALASMPKGPDVQAVLTLIQSRRRTGFEATHHSKAFEAAYAPAYRVVGAEWIDALSGRPSRR